MSKFFEFVNGLAQCRKPMCFPKLTNNLNDTEFDTASGFKIETVGESSLMLIKHEDQHTNCGQKLHNYVIITLNEKATTLYFNEDTNEFQGLRQVDEGLYVVTLWGIEVGELFLLNFSYHLVNRNDLNSGLTHDGTIHPIP